MWSNHNQDFRKIQTLVYLERYRDLGLSRCNICLKDFTKHERVKRFPRECDHIFHIKCLEVWLKIEASCPNCFKSYLGHRYRNVNVSELESYSTDPEKYSSLNTWQYQEFICSETPMSTANNLLFNAKLSSSSKTGIATPLDTHKAVYDFNQFSPNPFQRMSYHRHQVYMDELKDRKKQEVQQKLLR